MRAILVSTVLALALAALSGCTFEQHDHYNTRRESAYYRVDRDGDYHGYRSHREYRDYRDYRGSRCD